MQNKTEPTGESEESHEDAKPALGIRSRF